MARNTSSQPVAVSSGSTNGLSSVPSLLLPPCGTPSMSLRALEYRARKNRWTLKIAFCAWRSYSAQRSRSCTHVIFVSLPEARCLRMVCNTRDDVEVRQWHNRDCLCLSCRLVMMPVYVDFKVGLTTYSFCGVKPGRRRERE